MKVTVSKKTWLRGGARITGVVSALLSGEKMCCLGFAAIQCGQTRADIRDVDLPGAIRLGSLTQELRESPFVQRDMVGTGVITSALARQAADINDDELITDTQRMKRLRALFKSAGHQIVFVP